MDEVFISYKREERDIAERLATVLTSRGWSVWWDVDLQAGEHFDDEIEEAIRSVKCVIVLWSKRAVTSRYIKDEATFALKLKKLVPVNLEGLSETELPMRFQVLHMISLVEWQGSTTSPAFLELEKSIEAKVGRQTLGQGKTFDPTQARLTPDAGLAPKRTLLQTAPAVPSAADLGVNPRFLLELHQKLKSWTNSANFVASPQGRAKAGSSTFSWGCISRDELYDFAHFLEQPFTPRHSKYSISGGTAQTLKFVRELLATLESEAAKAVNCIPDQLKNLPENLKKRAVAVLIFEVRASEFSLARETVLGLSKFTSIRPAASGLELTPHRLDEYRKLLMEDERPETDQLAKHLGFNKK